ncbi:response regulator [Flavobacterium sp. D33]|nr:response regulator [Flavobacterium selenitireducens]
MSVFLADDDSDDRTIFSEAFEKIRDDLQTELLLFENGLELIAHMKSTTELPHIIFLDLNMPLKSGKECLRELRQDRRFDGVSIAIYSTSNAASDIEDTFSGGANVYIHKPDNFDQLKKALRQVLKLNWQFHMTGMNKETFFLNI